MNNIDIQVVKSNLNRKVVIDHITINMGEKPHIWFSDCDSMTDYYHGYHVTIKELIEELKTRGADTVRVTTNYSRYNDPEGKELEQLLRKINKIAKQAAYRNQVKTEIRSYDDWNGKKEWLAVEGNFIREYE